MESRELEIGGRLFSGCRIGTQHAVILLISGRKGNLGCGYFSVETADRVGDRLAVVTGVGSFEEMLEAAVVKVSSAAAACGVVSGMHGREALEAMER